MVGARDGNDNDGDTQSMHIYIIGIYAAPQASHRWRGVKTSSINLEQKLEC